ncbi:MAG: peroxidase-related enzyme, partial [Chloroflexales bacterium]|nr:peroxidase-related enzyme [Chloroflexales bacterium]
EPETIQRIFDDGVGAELGARERAVVDYAVKLTNAPNEVSAADLVPLRALGASDAEILDITHAAAIFAWANRLLQTLGEPTRE